MVYNFSVGDTFQYHTTGNNCCFQYQLKVIASKNYSLNGDTVIYGINSVDRSTISNSMTWTSTTTISSSTLTEKYFDLNMPFAVPTLSNGGYYQKDTIILAYCNNLTSQSQAYCYSNFECDSKIEKYSSSLGHTYSYFYSYQASIYSQGYQPITQQLIYHHKIGGQPCGQSNLSAVLVITKNKLIIISSIFHPTQHQVC